MPTVETYGLKNGTMTDRVALTINLDQGPEFRRHFKWEQSIDTYVWYCFLSVPGINKYERLPTYDATSLQGVYNKMSYLRTCYVGGTTLREEEAGVNDDNVSLTQYLQNLKGGE
jgi:hypothetical protein